LTIILQIISANGLLFFQCTSQSRLKLYESLEVLGADVCYFDTDSLIYVVRDGEVDPIKKGECLGDMKSELPSDTYISEFVSGGY